jgi:hypothetical protein
MWIILLSWLFYLLFFIGIGSFSYNLFGFSLIKTIQKPLIVFWVGWCSVIAFLQIWHLFLKIDAISFLVLIIISLLGWKFSYTPIKHYLKSILIKQWIVPILFLFICGIWLAALCTSSSFPYDLGLYHLQAVMWNSTYAIIPGLGNLSTRLAFNNSNFLYAALLDLGPWEGKAFYFANGLLVYVFVLQIVLGVFSFIRSKNKDLPSLFLCLMLAPTIAWIYGNPAKNQISGYSTDILIFIFGVIIFTLLLDFIFNHKDEENSRIDLFTISILCFCGVTIKISFLIFMLGVQAYLLFTWIKRFGWRNKTIWKAYFLPILLILIWIIRNLILSGYFIFPSINFGLPVPWRIPGWLVDKTRNDTLNWGKALGKDVDTAGWIWFKPWVKGLNLNLKWAVAISFLLFLTSMGLRLKKQFRWNTALFASLLIPVFSLIFWFFSSPNPRFAGASFWIIAAILGIIVFEQLQNIHSLIPPRIFLILLSVSFLTVNFWVINSPILPIFRSELKLLPDRISVTQTNYLTTINDGLSIHYPNSGSDQCWLTPIPCSPHKSSNAFPIDPLDIKRGFRPR